MEEWNDIFIEASKKKNTDTTITEIRSTCTSYLLKAKKKMFFKVWVKGPTDVDNALLLLKSNA